jgi:hypothetical protein
VDQEITGAAGQGMSAPVEESMIWPGGLDWWWSGTALLSVASFMPPAD